MKNSGRSDFSKKFGQVFLHDRNIARQEVELLGAEPGDRVLEIGPGPGILTGILLDRGLSLTAVEPDHVQYENLAVNFSEHIRGGKLRLIKEDFLKLDPEPYDFIIGNIPYNLSSPILFKLFEYDFRRAVLMVQKEFALRMVAREGTDDYSRLTVNTCVRFNVAIARTVPRTCFSPVPKVDSAIVRLEKKPFTEDFPMEFLDGILARMFSMRRKKIKNSIPEAPEEFSGKRPEDLSVEDILRMCRMIYQG